MVKSGIGFATFSLENLVLGLLMDRPRHGYQLYKDYEEIFLSIWKVGRSKFYAMLVDLHDKGYLVVTSQPQDDRPTRKIYHLTEAGRAQFLDWVYQPVTPMRAIRVEFLAKLRFFTLLGLPNVERLLDAQIAVCQSMITDWLDIQATAYEGDPFFDLVHDFRRRQIGLIIEWLYGCRDRLTEHTPD